MTISLASVQVGKVAPLGPKAVPSGYVKHGVSGPVRVTSLGLVGDEQADLSVHGGPDKAVYGYASHHYAAWSNEFPEHAARFVAGSMGENLTIIGTDEGELCVGDVHRVGTAVLQVGQPRQPCFKLSTCFGDARLPRAMVRTGRSGWYYRVLEDGALRAGDKVVLVDRPQPAFPFARLVAIVNGAPATRVEALALSTMPELPASLCQSLLASKRFDSLR